MTTAETISEPAQPRLLEKKRNTGSLYPASFSLSLSSAITVVASRI